MKLKIKGNNENIKIPSAVLTEKWYYLGNFDLKPKQKTISEYFKASVNSIYTFEKV